MHSVCNSRQSACTPRRTHPSERCPTDPAAAPAEMQISRREISRRGAYRSEGSRRRSSAQIESRAHLARRRAPPAAPQAAARVVRDAQKCRYATTARLRASSVGKQRVAASLSSGVIRGNQRSSEVIRQHLSEAEGWHPQCHLPSVSFDEGVKGGASAHCGANGFDRRLN